MDDSSAPERQGAAAPIFGAYRRGYDPEQVDRYVGEQQRRLDDALHRASEAERKLGAAIGQLRELHRRLAVLENEDRSPQAPALDTLGERVQRILNEAWEGAYALRQSAEQEAAEQRSRSELAAAELVAAAESQARLIEEEAVNRRRKQHELIEQERSRAVAQISYLHEQRKMAVDELLRLKDVIETSVAEMLPASAAGAPGGPHPGAGSPLRAPGVRDTEDQPPAPTEATDGAPRAEAGRLAEEERVRREAPVRFQRPTPHGASEDPEPPRTMPVHRLDSMGSPGGDATREAARPDPATLVREHRASESRHEQARPGAHAPSRRPVGSELETAPSALGGEADPRPDGTARAGAGSSEVDPGRPRRSTGLYDFEAD